ncbi:MAG: hypothetical protein AAF641_03460 [Pseudomonadota bacterium]
MNATSDTGFDVTGNLLNFPALRGSKPSWFGVIALVCGVLQPHGANADILRFFQSAPIHEDDRLSGEYDLAIDECRFDLTHYSPNRKSPRSVTHTKIDLSYFLTVPPLASGDGGRYSSRSTVTWFTERHIREELEALNAELFELRVTWFTRSRLTETEIRERRSKLENMLARIEGGEFGEFAQNNHAVVHEEGNPEKPSSVRIALSLQLPTRVTNGKRLKDAVFRHQLDHCPEIIPSILEKMDRHIEGMFPPAFLDDFDLEFDPDTERLD